MAERHKTLKFIALFEAFKGAVVILAGCGCLALIHRDLEVTGEAVVHFLHLNPAQHYPKIFLEALSHVDRKELLWLAAGAGLYATMKFIEAYGLWFEKVWAEWFAIVTGGMYIPVELYELYVKATAVKAVLTAFNIALVIYLIWLRMTSKETPEAP